MDWTTQFSNALKVAASAHKKRPKLFSLSGILDRCYAEGRTDLIEHAERRVPKGLEKRHDARARKKMAARERREGQETAEGLAEGVA